MNLSCKGPGPVSVYKWCTSSGNVAKKTNEGSEMIKNKYTKLLAAMGITLFAGAAQAAYIDIAVNGGFETGDFTGWTQFPGSLGAAGQTIVSPGSSGTFAVDLNEPNPAANIIKQANLRPGDWTAGQAIDVSFDYKGSAGAGGVLFAELFMELDGGGVGPGSGIISVIAAPTAAWQTFSYSGIVGPDTSGGVTLQLNATCGADSGCFSNFQIDNVTISADLPSEVPVPAAVWLFGSGLLGLVGVARRKKVA